MAFGVRPPAMGEWIMNLGEAAEYMFDHNIFQENLVGVDYCERMVRETNPERSGRKPKKTRSAERGIHGYKTIADIMTALNPFTGDFYRRSTADQPVYARDVLPDGRAPRASVDALCRRNGTVADACSSSPTTIRGLMRYIEYMKVACRCTTISSTSGIEALPGYEHNGERRILLGCWGAFQDPDHLRLPV